MNKGLGKGIKRPIHHDVEEKKLTVDRVAFDQELVNELTEVRLQTEHGRVMMPVVPLDMGIVFSDLFEIHDEDEAYDLARAELGMSAMIAMEWHEDGAPTFGNSLEVLILGERAYIFVSPEPAVAQHWEAIAMCEPGSPEVLEAFFLDLAHDNGATYSVDLFSSLPTKVSTTYLSCDAVAAGFATYLDWDEARSPGAWLHAARYLPRSVGSSPDLVIGSMALRKEDNEFSRRRYINAYAAAVYAEEPAAVAN
jgi:hypothetical protein